MARIGVFALAVVSLAFTVAGDAAAAAQPSGDARAGEAVFRAECAMCHGPDASGMMGVHPSLRGAVARLTREGVEVTVRRGRQTQPPMPAFDGRLDDAEIADVVAYVDSLPPGPRNFGSEGTGGGGMGGGGMGGGMMGGGDDEGFGALGLALAAAGGAALALAVAALLRRPRELASGRPDAAADILSRRYAAGELSAEDYRRMRDDLGGQPSS